MAPQSLSREQTTALFNLLGHYETYSEIESFKSPKAIFNYGYPFQTQPGFKPGSPVLQRLFSKVVLLLPGLKTVSSTFWESRVLPLISALSSADLSESYDKGILGQRKTLSTASAALLEYVGRGSFGGLRKQDLNRPDGDYDVGDPVDDASAWEDLVQQGVYGSAIDEIFKDAERTDKLEDHPPRVQAAHRYIILNLASILHYIFVISPKGPSLLTLLEGAHKLIPYTMIRSTLKIGNAASMINAMVRVVLAKASVGAVTNWLGVSQGADEGMNLLQIIVSTVLGWDVGSLKKRASQIEKDKNAPSKEQLSKLRDYVHQDREEHERCRKKSNRQRLVDVLCRHNPDLLTPILRDLVTAYEPIIRAVHNAVNLSGTVYDAQVFIDDFIKLSKAEKRSHPSVSDYVALLEKHQSSTHRFLHQVTKNGKEMTEEYRVFTHEVTKHFQQSAPDSSSITNDDRMRDALNNLVTSLTESESDTVIHEIDDYAAYLSVLYFSSTERSTAIFSGGNSGSTQDQSLGPGAYIERWQSLLDETAITPAKAEGPVRSGASLEVKKAARTDVDGEKKGDERKEKEAEQQMRQAPDVRRTRELLGQRFYELLRSWDTDDK
ncbi:MAG: hypothetical protein Q9160_001031 [Pyrenula sp. 1 TL-2023]